MNFIDFGIVDAVDIALVAILLWQIYRAIRGTAALTIFAAVFLVYLLWVAVKLLGLQLLTLILEQITGVGVIALLIVFQQEVRRYLLAIGMKYSSGSKGVLRRLFAGTKGEGDSTWASETATAVVEMSRAKTGALIVVERTTSLGVYTSTGDVIDARINSRLIENIFFKNSPLHDGAMIIRDGRIWAVRCILPTSDNPYIAANLGMRHRAAAGITENSDAVVVVVSEETGRISLVEAGQITVVSSAAEIITRLVGSR